MTNKPSPAAMLMTAALFIFPSQTFGVIEYGTIAVDELPQGDPAVGSATVSLNFARAGVSEINNNDLEEAATATAPLRMGVETADGAILQVHGPLYDPFMTSGNQRLDFTGDAVTLGPAAETYDTPGPLDGVESQELAEIVATLFTVRNIQTEMNQVAIDQMVNWTPPEFVSFSDSGLPEMTQSYEICSPEWVGLMVDIAFTLETTLENLAHESHLAAHGADLAQSRSNQPLAAGFNTYVSGLNALSEGFVNQLQVVQEMGDNAFANCDPSQWDLTGLPGVVGSATLYDNSSYASAGPTGAGDIGSPRDQRTHTVVQGKAPYPDLAGRWNWSDGFNFTALLLDNRLKGELTGRCEQYQGPISDLRELTFAGVMTRYLKNQWSIDAQFPLYDEVEEEDAGVSGFNLAYTQELARQEITHCADPWDFAAGLKWQPGLTRNFYTQALQLGYLSNTFTNTPNFEADANADLRVTGNPNVSEELGYPGSVGYQFQQDLSFNVNYLSADTPLDLGDTPYRVSQGVKLNPLRSITFPDIMANDAFMPDCFAPQHYGDFRIGPRRYIRLFVDPNLIAALDMQGLEIIDVHLDPFRGPLTDPYMAPQQLGGGAWGQPFDDQWAIKKVGFNRGARSAWNHLDTDAEPVVVAVIDTGLDWFHPDLAADSVWRNDGEIADNGIDDDGNGYVDDVIGYDFMERDGKPWDMHGHGTMVSGIIAAERDNNIGIAGINPNTKIMVLRVSNTFGHTHASYIAEAIAYAADNGAQIINISMGGAMRSQLEREAIAYARDKGVLVIAAAGNEGIELEDYGPGTEDGVFTVAATDLNDRHADFSNTGAAVDIAAPGVDVLSLRARGTDVNLGAQGEAYTPGQNFVGSDNQYIRASGTSFATPIVTGAASVLMIKEPNLSAEQIKTRFAATAWDIGKPGPDQQTGAGLLDASTALGIDNGFFIAAEVSRLNPNGESQTLEIYGNADADRFKRAWLQIGEGEDPERWKFIGLKLKRPVKDALLSEIPLTEFEGTGVWTVRLNVEHKSGTVRRATRPIRLK